LSISSEALLDDDDAKLSASSALCSLGGVLRSLPLSFSFFADVFKKSWAENQATLDYSLSIGCKNLEGE